MVPLWHPDPAGSRLRFMEGSTMSSRQLEDRREQEQIEQLAEHLGLTMEEFDTLAPDIDTNESSDGMVYSYVLNFPRDAQKEILSKVIGLTAGSLTMQVDLNVLDDDEGAEDDHME
jgi:hypothetical protein